MNHKNGRQRDLRFGIDGKFWGFVYSSNMPAFALFSLNAWI
jgi:hypothetical protein